MAKTRTIIYILCEHEREHENFDPSLLRKCKGTNLVECVKCYTLESEFGI